MPTSCMHRLGWASVIACAVASASPAPSIAAQELWGLTASNHAGLRIVVEKENNDPELRIFLPGQSDWNPPIRVLFPEHVTALPLGKASAQQLYLFHPGQIRPRPEWFLTPNYLEYERDLEPGIHMRARATVEDDGVRFRYEFDNRTPVDYDMITAVTDPRLTSIFHDERLERTFVHHAEGFELLASETPDRLEVPLSKWLPVRYLAAYRWPILRTAPSGAPTGSRTSPSPAPWTSPSSPRSPPTGAGLSRVFPATPATCGAIPS